MLRFIHILGAVMFLGGIIADMAWMKFAERTRRPSDLAFASKTVTLNDFIIVLPGAGLLMLSGVLMILTSAEVLPLDPFATLLKSLENGWLVASIGMFSISGAVWMFLVLPHQRGLTIMSEQNIGSESLPGEFFQLLGKWYLWAMVATVTPLIALALMVFRPHLW